MVETIVHRAGVPPRPLSRLHILSDWRIVTVGLAHSAVGIPLQCGGAVRSVMLGPPLSGGIVNCSTASFSPPPTVHIFPLSPWTTFAMASSEMACVYAALILHDESISITVRLLWGHMLVALLIDCALGCLINTARHGHVLYRGARASFCTCHASATRLPFESGCTVPRSSCRPRAVGTLADFLISPHLV